MIDKLKEFEKYYRNQWIKFLDSNILNYNKLDIYKRSNSYIEIYNKYIKNMIRPFIYCKKINTIDWIYFIGFLIEKENDYKSKLIERMNNEENKISENSESEEEILSQNEGEKKSSNNYKKKKEI